jgi:ACR3 family arsenite transporter
VLVGARHFVEPAVASAIALFGLRSGAALAMVEGVLDEAPVMPRVGLSAPAVERVV